MMPKFKGKFAAQVLFCKIRKHLLIRTDSFSEQIEAVQKFQRSERKKMSNIINIDVKIFQQRTSFNDYLGFNNPVARRVGNFPNSGWGQFLMDALRGGQA